MILKKELPHSVNEILIVFKGEVIILKNIKKETAR